MMCPQTKRGAGTLLLLDSRYSTGQNSGKISGNTDRAHSTDSPCSFHCPTTGCTRFEFTRHTHTQPSYLCTTHTTKVTDVRRKTKTGNRRAASAWTKMAGREPADWRDGDGRGVVSTRHVPSDRSTIKIKIRGGEVGMKMVGDRREIEASREEKGERECTGCTLHSLRVSEGSNVPLAG